MRTITRFIVRTLWILFGVGVVLVVLLFVLIAKGYIGYMPPISDLQNPIDKYASQLITEDNVVLGSYALKGNNRVFISYDELNPKLVEALIATEDRRFVEHSGIDLRGVFRAVFKTMILGNKSSGGGSTITQQLAKQLYSPKAENFLERLMQKPIEWVIAVELEREYTKEEIVTLYLNQFDFLYQAVGIESAAKTYFSTTPRKLKVEEAALLVGMAKNPSYYNPKRYPDNAKQRRNVVLQLMANEGYLTQTESDSLKNLPINLNFNRQSHKNGGAPYYREFIRNMMMAKKPHRADFASWQEDDYLRAVQQWENSPIYGWCNKNKKANGEHYNIYTDGLRIYTGINAEMQKMAEEAMIEHIATYLQVQFDREKAGRKTAPFSSSISLEERTSILDKARHLSDRYRTMKYSGISESEILASFDEPTSMTVFSYGRENGKPVIQYRDTIMTPNDSIRYYKGFLRSGFMAMDNWTGEVRAYVGGLDFSTFQYDMVTQGRRQVGSVMKPYLYSMAMNEGFTPCDEMMHVQPHIRLDNGSIWSPKNAGASRVGDMVSIAWGLQNSSNWVTAWLMNQMSPYTFVELLRSFGITGYLDPVPSICLGASEISVAEMASGFTTFANAGIRTSPLWVTRIEDQYGNVVSEFVAQTNEVLPDEATYKTLYMLRGVMNGGTGSRVRFRYGVQADMGGKTGTSQNQSDGWFMCFTPRISTACWVGGEDRSIHFDGLRMGQGANTALPITALFFKKIYGNKKLSERANSLGIDPALKFEIPSEFSDPCKRSKYEEMLNGGKMEPTEEQKIDDLFKF